MESPSAKWRRENPEKNRAHQKKYKERHREKVREMSRRYYASLSEEKKMQVLERTRIWRSKNREHVRRISAIYEHTKRTPEQVSADRERSSFYKKYRLSDEQKLKVAARNHLRKAVKSGRVIKEPCVICSDDIVEAHHDNGYDQEHELDVIWFCKKHHLEKHGKAYRKPLVVPEEPD